MGTELAIVWYVKVGGRVCGPLTLGEMQSLAGRGAIFKSSPVSRDRKSWRPASDLPDLDSIWSARPGSVRASSSHPPVQINIPPEPVSSIGAGVATLLGFGMGFLIVAGLLRAFWSGSTVSKPVATVQASSDPVIEATASYWMLLKGELSSSVPQGPQAIGFLAAKAERIESLPVLNVDPELVAYSLQLTELMQQVVQVGRRQSDPSFLIESFVRGAMGDPFGTARDQLGASKVVQDRGMQLQHRGTQLRAILSQRYGVEFPAL